LAVVILLGGLAFSLALFRHRIAALHDPGFNTIYQNAITAQPLPRHVLTAPGQFMTLDPTGRFLINSITNKPVFIVGDSPWLLTTRLNESDVDAYLSDRASRGFNYIWCTAAEIDSKGNALSNYMGDRAFDGPIFTHPNTTYWRHVDQVIRRAGGYGITVALNPGFVGLTVPEGYLGIYRNSSDATMTAYGAFLGARYKGFPNIIWALGGDVDPTSGVIGKLSDLAKGIRSEDSVHLIVAEGQPQHAALDTFAGTAWMDLNWLYFHTTNIPSNTAFNYSRSPWLPPFQGEGWYENSNSMTQLQIREQGYWSVLSGAYLGNAGFANALLYNFNRGADAQPTDPIWQSQLGSEGSIGQMHLGRLFRSREHWKLVPDTNHTVVTGGYDSRSLVSAIWERLRAIVHGEPYRLGSASSVAARTSDGQTVIAYIPNGNSATITVAMDQIVDHESEASCWWFSPRDGLTKQIGIFPTVGSRKFIAPDTKDWVLVIDSHEANLAAPGILREN
jgi:Protein of unknown function (DUF4038)/Putative collagen-binding domain of a collagenase